MAGALELVVGPAGSVGELEGDLEPEQIDGSFEALFTGLFSCVAALEAVDSLLLGSLGGAK